MITDGRDGLELSKCCGAEIEYFGGGYIDEDIAPIATSCKSCGEVLTINGSAPRKAPNERYR